METLTVVLVGIALGLGGFGGLLALVRGPRGSVWDTVAGGARIVGFLAIAGASASIAGIEVPPLPDETVPPVRPIFVVLGVPLGILLAIVSALLDREEARHARAGQ